ncbi:MAG TPA: hypothetical protein VJ783_02290 [Pirellulales bacterium]|nr:hypothetical protein [Pirellulales bacterium]
MAVLLVIVAALLIVPWIASRSLAAPDHEASARAALAGALDQWLTGAKAAAWLAWNTSARIRRKYREKVAILLADRDNATEALIRPFPKGAATNQEEKGDVCHN